MSLTPEEEAELAALEAELSASPSQKRVPEDSYQTKVDNAKLQTSTNPLAAVTGYAGRYMQAIPFADEVGSALAATMGAGSGDSWGDRYSSLQESQQAMREATKENYPIASTAGDVVSNIAAAGLMPSAAISKGASLGKTALDTGKIGAAYGAGYGLSNTDSSKETSDAGSDRIGNSIAGGLLGFGVGSAAPYVVRGAEIAGRGVANGASALERLLSGTKPTPKPDAATKIIASALKESGVSPRSLQASLLKNKNQPITIADVAPPDIQAYVEQAAQRPGRSMNQAVDFLENRNMAQPTRLVAAVEKYMGPVNYVDDVLRFNAEMGSDAIGAGYREAFDAVNNVGSEVNKTLNAISRHRLGPDIWKKATGLASDDGYAFEPRVVGNTVRNLNTREVDYVKKAIDDIVNPIYGNAEKNLDKSAVRSLTRLKNKMLAEVDYVNPAYEAARARFAEPASSLAALQEGRSFLRADDWIDAVETIKSASKGEKQAFLSGVSRDIIETLKAQGGDNMIANAANPAKNFVNNPKIRERLTALVGEKNVTKLLKDIATQGDMQDLGGKVLYNSATARRMASAEKVNENSRSAFEKLSEYLKQINVAQPSTVLGAAGKAQSSRNLDSVNEALILRLLNSNQKKNNQTLHEVSRAMNLDKIAEKLRLEQIERAKNISTRAAPLIGTGSGQRE